jgi:hypothetical protein
VCADAEVRCGDRSCSVSGFCPVSSTQRVVIINSPPNLQLLPVPAADSQGVVQVPRGWMYAFCDPGIAGTVSEPCEPGAYLCTSAVLCQAIMFSLLTHVLPVQLNSLVPLVFMKTTS